MLPNDTVTVDSGNDTEDFTLTTLDYAYFFTSLVIFLPTVVGNSLILIALYRFRELRSPMGLLIGNLALSDFLVGIAIIPMEIFGTLLDLSYYKYYCLVNIGTSLMLIGSSVLNMLVISVERFISVAYPLSHRSPKTKTITKVSIPIMWLLVFISGYLPLMGVNKLSQRSQCMYTRVFLVEYTIFISSFLAGCVLSNVVFFVLIIRVAVSHLRKVRRSKLDQHSIHLSRNLAKTYVMMIVSATFVVCWGPFCVLTVTGLFYSWQSYPTALRWAYFAGFLNSGINWMIYGFRNLRFRKAMKAVLTCKETIINSSQIISSNSIKK